MKYLKALLVILSFWVAETNAQQYTLSGMVIDTESGQPMAFANIRIEGTSRGTSANIQGEFELKLKKGNYNVIASFIGFKSDTASVNMDNNQNLVLLLNPVAIRMEEVTVLPGENPANEIIRRAIKARNEMYGRLETYEFQAYSKSVIKTTEDIGKGSEGGGISIGSDDGDLKITGIIENDSKGYYKAPDRYKDIITARKQSANLPPFINTLTGGMFIQNFYEDDVQFFDRPLPTALSDDAPDYYYYIIEDTLAQDNNNIFKIQFQTIDENDPGFRGYVYIIDGSYALARINAELNDAANPGNIFNKIAIMQQYMPYDENIFMPVDYRVLVEGNFLGIFKFGFEVNSVFHNYDINKELPDDIFSKAIITVQPEADKRDSTYWENTLTIPPTYTEKAAYDRLDSVASIERTFWERYSFLSDRVSINENYSFTNLLGLYDFNRVEGHILNFGVFADDLHDRRLYTNLNTSYGFSDKEFKWDLSGRYFLGDYRTSRFELNVFNKLEDLFGSSHDYAKFTSTWMSLFYKDDFRSYYYTKGFEFKARSEVFPVLELNAGFINRTDRSAQNNSDFSFFAKDEVYPLNKQIYDTRVNAFTAGFELDFRDYIEDGYYRRRFPDRDFNSSFSGSVTYSADWLGSNEDFRIYRLNWNTSFRPFASTQFRIRTSGILGDGAIPKQMLYALPGNLDGGGKDFSFRTMEIGEFYGDRAITLFAEYDIKDELFRLLNIPVLSDWQVLLNTHFSAGWADISTESAALLNEPFKVLRSPYMEAGFSLGHLLIPAEIEFTWRLTKRPETRSFVIGFNTFFL